MENIKLYCSKVYELIQKDEEENFKNFVEVAHEMLHNKTGPGNDFVGWVDLPINYDVSEIEKIKQVAQTIKDDCDVLVVIGIGGSYTGIKAAVDIFGHSFYNSVTKDKRNSPEIYFLGNNISSTYMSELFDVLENKSVYVNVISKSGTTTEPAIAFKIFRKYMEERYKEDSKKRILVTTDKNKGILKSIALQKGYTTFDIPDDIGGRYSILTPVGLLPIAIFGANIDTILQGAKDAYEIYNNPILEQNDCYRYAVLRNVLYRKGKVLELLVSYEPRLNYFAEWWKQLYSESEGKDGKGIFAAVANFTTDLHSVGQYIQDGLRNMFETIISIKVPRKNIEIEYSESDIDNLNFIAGKDVDFVCKKAMEGTISAHTNGGVPNIVLEVPELNEYYFGQMIYFFEKACGISGYLLGVNPFNQPGVEKYKSEMFKLLGK